MDDNMLSELCGDEELVLEPLKMPTIDPAQSVEAEMWEKYRVDVDFLKQYVEYAKARNSKEVMQELALMPPNTMSRIEMEMMVNECVDVLRRFDNAAEAKRAEAKASVDSLKSTSVSRADFDVRLARIVGNYHAFMAEGWKARARLLSLAQQTPIDVRQYKQDMDRYLRVWTAAKISAHFPMLGIAIL